MPIELSNKYTSNLLFGHLFRRKLISSHKVAQIYFYQKLILLHKVATKSIFVKHWLQDYATNHEIAVNICDEKGNCCPPS